MSMSRENILDILENVADPEIPVITINDLGILRDVQVSNDGHIKVYITPTYNGCPAMDMITVNIRSVLQDYGYSDVEVVSVLEPAWTTDWITDSGRKKLLDYGISPPAQSTLQKSFISGEKPKVICPQCASYNTELVSLFGSTACKAMYKCLDCLEPFDYFKCH
jgi:ring-1,2-phenylacetyl-CoA epoxidase subunit PaaD